MSKRNLVLLCFSLCAIFCTKLSATNTLPSKITEFVEDSIFRSATVGISFVSVESGHELGAYNAEKTLHTASLLKLLTTATVLSQKSDEWRYRTALSYSGVLENGVIVGNLIIKGVGDPTFNSRYFPQRDALQEIVSMLRERGVSEIEGNIVLDNSAFETHIPPTWLWEDLSNYYGAVVNPINYHDNSYTLSLETKEIGAVAHIIKHFPRQDLVFKSEVVASQFNSDNAYIFGSPLSKKRVVRGTLPAFRKKFNIKGAMPNPAYSFGKELQRTFEKEHVKLRGDVKIEYSGIETATIGYIKSPHLRDIVKETNRKSINLFAEALLYIVENTERKSRTKQIEAMKRYWSGRGLNTRALFLHDGSGLSPFNSVSPHFFTNLLREMSSNKAYRESLSVAGVDGTLRNVGKGTILQNNVFGKSGTMQQVCGYAGYLTPQSGKTVAFAIMVNDHTISNRLVRKKIVQLLEDAFYEL